MKLFIRSKIQFFESKSQQNWIVKLTARVVYQIKDTIFWKQITTESNGVGLAAVLFIRSKIQFFESKSQPLTNVQKEKRSCLSDQRYNFLKANHNTMLIAWTLWNVVYQIKDTIFWKQITTCCGAYIGVSGCLSDQRYNFLKANHNLEVRKPFPCQVVYQIKDTIFWKQITTVLVKDFSANSLFIRSKIQFFESKSQLTAYNAA